MNYRHVTRPPDPIERLLFLASLAALAIALFAVCLVGPKRIYRSAHNLLDAPVSKHAPQILTNVVDPTTVATERRATEIAQLLQRHWEKSMLAIEAVNIKDVTILEFHPDYENNTVILRGEAREFEALAAYINQLNATGLVNHVALMHEQAISREHVDTIEFELKGDL